MRGFPLLPLPLGEGRGERFLVLPLPLGEPEARVFFPKERQRTHPSPTLPSADRASDQEWPDACGLPVPAKWNERALFMEFQLGLSYDELVIGMKASFSKTVTETDVYLFAGISGDFNPMHVNEEFAKLTPFGTRIAHGALPQSLIAPVLGTRLPGLGTIAVEITTRFTAPTFFGDTITATAEVVELIEDKRRIRLKLTWTNQRSELVASGEALVIPPPKPELLTSKRERKEEDKMAFTSVNEIFEKMPTVFNAAAAAGLDTVIQYHIGGDQPGDWYVVIKGDACQVESGTHDSPSVALSMADVDWIALCNGELDGMSAFMSGKLKADGDIMLAQRIPSIFPLG